MSGVFTKDDYPVKWIRAKNLGVRWAQSQRGLNQGKVDKIADEFDPDAVGVIAVTMPNGNGRYHVIDGQHRVEAIKKLWGGNEYVPCQVLNKRDPSEAADIWLTINSDRTRPSAIDRFNVAVTAGREDECEIKDLLDEMGYTVGMDSSDGTISAVAACLSIHGRVGIGGLRETLLLIRAMWGMERDAYHNSILRGVARFLNNHEDFDRERLVSKVSKKYTPASILGAARSVREVYRGTIKENVERILVESYNHNLRSDRRLEEQ